MDIIQKYLDKNKQFRMKKVLSLIHSRFKLMDVNINLNGIETVLKTLIRKNCIVERSTLSRDNIFNNEKRKEIYEYIQDYPGIFFNELKRNLNICNQVLVWHLNILRKFKLIRKKMIENHAIYYCSFVRSIDAEKHHYIRKSIDIINYLKAENKGISKTRLAEALNMHYNTLKKYIEKLEDYSLLIKKQKSRNIVYFLDLMVYDKIKYKFNLE
ncbi:MAG: hypothetical protein JXA99_07970 [Candidatus Lokiarchaeota archaeon]|nr:hypothetical protein [Candidatus Lokiarchaeota archaeon]